MTNTVPLFQKNTVFHSPTNSWSYWFTVPSGVRFVQPSYLSLVYTQSETLLAGQGSLTVLLNGNPLASRILPTAASAAMPWRITLPTEMLKTGFNEIRLVDRHRSIDGLCRDIDNEANWVRWSTDSALVLTRLSQMQFPLAAYPYPFLDPLARQPAQSVLRLPATYTAADVSALLNIASDWGNRSPRTPLALRVLSSPATVESGQEVVVGTLGELGLPSSADLSAGTGLLQSMPIPSFPYQTRLQVTGVDAAGVSRATQALATPQWLDLCTTDSLKVPVDPEGDASVNYGAYGRVPLSALGVSVPITLSGAFHQQTEVLIHRPLRCAIGKQSHLLLHFRHSTALEPTRSVLSVAVNGVPAGNVCLTAFNAQHGVLDVPLPIDQLGQNTWL